MIQSVQQLHALCPNLRGREYNEGQGRRTNQGRRLFGSLGNQLDKQAGETQAGKQNCLYNHINLRIRPGWPFYECYPFSVHHQCHFFFFTNYIIKTYEIIVRIEKENNKASSMARNDIMGDLQRPKGRISSPFSGIPYVSG